MIEITSGDLVNVNIETARNFLIKANISFEKEKKVKNILMATSLLKKTLTLLDVEQGDF